MIQIARAIDQDREVHAAPSSRSRPCSGERDPRGSSFGFAPIAAEEMLRPGARGTRVLPRPAPAITSSSGPSVVSTASQLGGVRVDADSAGLELHFADTQSIVAVRSGRRARSPARPRPLERLGGISRFKDDFEPVVRSRREVRIRADGDAAGQRAVAPRPGPRRLGKTRRMLVAAPGVLDQARRSRELVCAAVEHRLHLAQRQAQAAPRRSRSEAGRAAAWVLEAGSSPRAGPPPRRARSPVAVEARAQVGFELGEGHLRNVERGGDRLACDVVGRAAEAPGDDQMVNAGGLTADEIDDPVGLVGHGTARGWTHAERLEGRRESHDAFVVLDGRRRRFRSRSSRWLHGPSRRQAVGRSIRETRRGRRRRGHPGRAADGRRQSRLVAASRADHPSAITTTGTIVAEVDGRIVRTGARTAREPFLGGHRARIRDGDGGALASRARDRRRSVRRCARACDGARPRATADERVRR